MSARPEHEQVLVELSRWLAQALQYGGDHPSCAGFAARTHAAVTRALETDPVIAFGLLKDNVMIGDHPGSHPAVRTRVAPRLHERGVLLLRFVRGVTAGELDAFLQLALLPVKDVFDAGGMQRLALDRGVRRIQIEELAHDLSDEQGDALQRRARLRAFFTDALRHLLARRDLERRARERIVDLLASAEIAVELLEDQGGGVAEAAAGMALMARDEEARTGEPLAEKLRGILAALAPATRERLLLGFPPLVGEFRAALAWATDGYHEGALARLVFPAFRAQAHDLEAVLYAMSVLVPHNGRRFSTLRRVGLMLHDLPLDDEGADEALVAIARPVEEFESYRRERVCLVEPALRARRARATAALAGAWEAGAMVDVTPLDEAAIVREVVRIAGRTRQFDRLAARLPAVAARYAASGSPGAVAGMVRGLDAVGEPTWRDLAAGAADRIVRGHAAAMFAEVDRTAAVRDEELVSAMRLLVTRAPGAAIDHVAECRNDLVRKLLLDELAGVGPRLLPVLRSRLTNTAPSGLVHVLALLPGLGGGPEDLMDVARHRDEKMRLEVVRVLKAMDPDEKAMDIVVRALADGSTDVRQAARPLLRGDVLGATAVGLLGRLVTDEAQPEETRRAAIEALGQSRQDAAAQLLFHLLQPHGLLESGAAATLRDLAAAALRSCRAPSAARHFEAGMSSSVWRVRRACERAARGGS